MKTVVLTAYAQSASGPGWANQPIWVIVRSASGQLRQECIQPIAQTPNMALLYRISQEAHSLMAREAARLLKLEVAE